MGYLRALTDLGLMNYVRYVGGISGGSWASGMYTYAQLGAPGVAATDEELLGKIVMPEDISLDGRGTVFNAASLVVAVMMYWCRV